jgi:hypothetical protein
VKYTSSGVESLILHNQPNSRIMTRKHAGNRVLTLVFWRFVEQPGLGSQGIVDFRNRPRDWSVLHQMGERSRRLPGHLQCPTPLSHFPQPRFGLRKWCSRSVQPVNDKCTHHLAQLLCRAQGAQRKPHLRGTTERGR